MKRFGIVGFGRFGELLAGIARADFAVRVVEADPKRQRLAQEKGFEVVAFEALADVDFICLAVPISSLEQLLQKLAPLVNKKQVVMDVCSVKVYPAGLMQNYLPTCQLLATHPLFGPDSAKAGLDGLQIALCPLRIDEENLGFIKDFWANKGVFITQTTPDAHDHDMIFSLALTHTISRLIIGMELPSLTLTTKSFNALKQVADLSAKDTPQLFHDMLYYNPYLKELKDRLERATAQTLARLDAIADEQAKI